MARFRHIALTLFLWSAAFVVPAKAQFVLIPGTIGGLQGADQLVEIGGGEFLLGGGFVGLDVNSGPLSLIGLPSELVSVDTGILPFNIGFLSAGVNTGLLNADALLLADLLNSTLVGNLSALQLDLLLSGPLAETNPLTATGVGLLLPDGDLRILDTPPLGIGIGAVDAGSGTLLGFDSLNTDLPLIIGDAGGLSLLSPVADLNGVGVGVGLGHLGLGVIDVDVDGLGVGVAAGSVDVLGGLVGVGGVAAGVGVGDIQLTPRNIAAADIDAGVLTSVSLLGDLFRT